MENNVLKKMEHTNDVIYKNRCKIAELKRQKIEGKAMAWGDANGLAKEKEAFVESQVAELGESIGLCEAKIELAYNTLKLLEWEQINE